MHIPLPAQGGPMIADSPSSHPTRAEPVGGDVATDTGPGAGAPRVGNAEEQEIHDPDAAALRAVAEEIATRFPLAFDDTTLVLYDVDPEHLQAQWQLNPGDVERARRLFPPGAEEVHAELRLRRVRRDGSMELVTSVPCDPVGPEVAAGAHFSLRNDGADYEAELGLASAAGGWVALVRSNRAQLPPLAVKPMAWGAIAAATDAEFAADSRAFPGGTRGADSTEDASEWRRIVTTKVSANAGESATKPVPANEPHPLPESQRQAGVEPALAAEGAVLHPVFPNPLTADGGAEVFHPSAAGGPDAITPTRAAERPALGPTVTSVGAWADLPPPLLPSTAAGGPSDWPFYDPRTALSSRALQGPSGPEEELEVHAELIVYGYASPGKVIDLFGHSLQVGAKGHFFLRRSVDDPVVLSRALSDLPPQLPEESLSE